MRTGWILLQFFIYVWIILFALGCQKQIRTWSPIAELVAENPPPTLQKKGPGAELPNELNSAKAAALYVATLPDVENSWIYREIRLHTALFLASYEGRLGDATFGFLLDEPRNVDIGSLAIDLSEFRLRVLAGLSKLNSPFEWAMISYQNSSGISRAPSQAKLASRSPTHISFRIIERFDEQATILAEIASHTPMGRSVRQRVTCTYDGQQWTISSTGFKSVW